MRKPVEKSAGGADAADDGAVVDERLGSGRNGESPGVTGGKGTGGELKIKE